MGFSEPGQHAAGLAPLGQTNTVICNSLRAKVRINCVPVSTAEDSAGLSAGVKAGTCTVGVVPKIAKCILDLSSASLRECL